MIHKPSSIVIETQISALLSAKFEEDADYKDCFVVEVKHHIASNKLEIMVDADGGITLDRCKLISRWVEASLDESRLIGETYSLEVSSPGVGRPLRLLRQYHQNMGRTIEVTTTSGLVQRGKLIAVSDEALTLEFEQKQKVGKKNIKEIIQMAFSFEELSKAVVKITF